LSQHKDIYDLQMNPCYRNS